jgi:hypothetical protein
MKQWVAAAAAVAVTLCAVPTSAQTPPPQSGSQNLVVTVGPTSTPPVIGGGGGGGGGTVTTNTGVTVSGRAYPLSTVVVLRNGMRAVSTIAGPDGRFSATLSNIASGSHTISLYGEDEAGRRSVLFSFPITVTSGAMTTVSGIFISPTITTDKIEVRRGDPIVIFGKTSPNSNVTLEINSEPRLFEYTPSDGQGVYLYNMDSSRLAYGSHTAASRAVTSTEISSQSESVGFQVGSQNVLRPAAPISCEARRGDVNCDYRVNLIDYSIVAYWYNRPGTVPAKVDLNGDGRVTLVDLSILAYYWTG